MNTLARVWSTHQQAVFADVATGSGHTMVDAVAGSGKTTTILEALHHIDPSLSVVFAAFATANVADIKAKNPPGNVEVTSLHSFGLRAMNKLSRRTVDKDKLRNLVRDLAGKSVHPTYQYEWRASVAKCVGLCKGYLAHDRDAIDDVITGHQLCPPERADERPDFIADVLAVLDACRTPTKKNGPIASVDFDDMIWLPVVLDMNVPQFDRVFVDETQDLNAAQIALVLKMVKPGGRILAVGDPLQAIYGFRGAADDAFDRVREGLGAKVLPLSVSYRCARAVLAEAQKYVPHIQPAPDAAEGLCVPTGRETMLKNVADGDFILSRANAPLMSLCLQLLKAGRKAVVRGRDIGTKLTSVMKRAKTDDVTAMLAYVDAWAKVEIERLVAKDRDTAMVEDTRDCIEALSEGETSVAAVVAKIERLFSDGTEGIILSSTHKAKGLERDRVWLLRDTYLKQRRNKNGAMQPMKREETNLYYVAVTRARKELYLVGA